MPTTFQNLEFVYFALGCLTVIAYAWQQFNQPTFPDQDTLPHVLEPLRYLFLGPTYRRARITYVGASLLLYCLLVLAGPNLFDALEQVGGPKTNIPIQFWALLVALIIVGLIPNSNIKWIAFIETQLRRFVHSFFLVPDGTLRTIGLLEDARYDPPATVSRWPSKYP